MLLSACCAGVFVPTLASADSVIVTAAAHDRTSFGCQADNDWTFFGDALVNRALRRNQPMTNAMREAQGTIAGLEGARKICSHRGRRCGSARACPIGCRRWKGASRARKRSRWGGLR